MKSEKEEIDRLIEQALTDEEAEFYHKLDEQNLMEMVGGLFQGKLKWLAILMVIIQGIMFGFSIYFAIQFFNATELMLMLKYGAGGFLLVMAVGMIKIYHWMEIHKNIMIREIKRMELQISIIASRLKEK